MKMKELEQIRGLLLRIRNPNALVHECMAYLDKDIALRLKQSKEFKENIRGDYELNW